tara:strand:- start:1184 stop:1318 length:135 start_codon:yes stop_codon:yes gene_type:complete
MKQEDKEITYNELAKAMENVLDKLAERDEKRLKEGYFDKLKKNP